MELLTPILTKVVSRLVVASIILFMCAMVGLYGDLWGLGHAYPLISPYHRAMVVVTVLLVALIFIYGLPRYLILALVLINLVWLLGPFFTLGELKPLVPLLPRVLICAVIAMLALGYYIATLGLQIYGPLPEKFSSLMFLPHCIPPRYPELSQSVKEWRSILRKRQRQIPLGKRLFCQTSANIKQACILMIGPPKSGKTSALLNAELIFSLPAQQQAARNSLSSTKHPQFWLADNALWCDTPGRYFDPEQVTPDSTDEWQAVTKQLAAMKAVTDIEGIIFVIDCPRILLSTPQQLTEYAALCRTHLRVLQQQMARQLPLYLFVSQVDQLVGFREYFHDISLKERHQLLGVTFELHHKGPLLCIDTISQHLTKLVKRIDKQVLAKQHQSDDVSIRKGIECFPANVEALTRALLLFIEPLVASLPEGSFKEGPALQGVYLGCSELCRESLYTHPQSLVRQWVKESKETESPTSSESDEQTSGHTVETLPRSYRHYFIKALFKYRIIDDYRLRLSLYQQQFSTRLRRGALYMATLLVSATAVYMITKRYDENQRFFSETQQALSRLDERLSVTTLPLDLALNKLKQLVATRGYGLDPSASLSGYWGLGMPEQWAERTNRVYNQWLIDHLLPKVEKVAHDQLTAQLAEGQPQRLFTTLSVYLMLQGELECDSAFLEKWFSAHPLLLSVFEHQENLPLFLRRLFRETRWQSTSLHADRVLIDAARQRLLQHPLADYLYQDIVQQLGAISLPIIELPQLITASHPLLFTFRGKLSPAAGLYNITGVQYWDKQVVSTHFPIALARVQKILLGTQPLPFDVPQFATEQQLWQQVSLVHWKEYRHYWQDFLNGLRLNLTINEQGSSTVNQRQRIEFLLKNFTSQDSQLRQLLLNVAQQTQLGLAPQDDGSTTTPRTIQERQQRRDNVDHYFLALHRFVETPNNSSSFSLEQLELALTRLYVALQATGITTDQQFKVLISEQANTPDFSPFLLYLDQLPPPLPQLFQHLLSTARQQVTQQRWAINAEQINQDIIQYCRQHLMGRYPFAASSIDADPRSVVEMFSPQGKLDRYFTQHLADKVDSHRQPWRLTTADNTISPRLLMLFEQGKKIQQQLFPQSSSQLGLDITLTIKDLATGVTQLIIDNDDQQFRYVHGPLLQQKIAWPAPKPSARFQIRAVAAEGRHLWHLEQSGYWGVLRWLERSKKQFAPRSRQTDVLLGEGDEQAILSVNGLGMSVTNLIRLFRRFDCSITE